MDIRALRYFVEVVKRRGFTAAANALFVTQPTISKMIRQIEEEVGAVLLIRDGRNITPTETGRIVYQRGLEILELQTRLEEELAEANSGMSGELTIAIPPMGSRLLTPMLSDFHRLHPAVRLKLFERGSLQAEADLRANVCEIGGILMPIDHAEFSALTLCESPLMLVSRIDSPWQGRATVSLVELADATFIMYGEGFMLNNMVNVACAKLGFTPTVSGRSSNWNMMAEMVGIGVGITLLPSLFCAELDPELFTSSVIAEPEINWTMTMAWRRSANLSSAARAWISLAESILAPHPH
jgi:DNA-binding transcriptional LysR family regulator